MTTRATHQQSRPKTLLLIASAVLLVVVLSLFALWPKNPAVAAGGPPGGFAVPVTIGTAKASMTESASEYLAQVHSDTSSMIRVRIAARIDRILVHDGQMVKQGQPLFIQDAGPQRETVKSLEAFTNVTRQDTPIIRKQIVALQADRASTQTQLAFNQTQLARYQSLAATNTVGKRDVEQFQTTNNDLQQKLHSMDANIQAQQSKIRQETAAIQRDAANAGQARATLDYYIVRAPYTGSLGEITARVGDVVDPSVPLTTITHNGVAEVDVAIPADQMAHVHVGSPLSITTTDGKPVSVVKVDFISPKVDPVSQTVLVKANIQNASLLADQKLRARLVWGHSKRLQVPVEAVFRLAGQPFVYVAEDPKKGQFTAHMRPVKLDGVEGNNYIIASGITEGQRVIVHGIQKLQEGAPVMDADKMGPPPASAKHD